MSDDVKLYWHPDFGAVLAMEADSDLDISDVLDSCSLADGLSSKDVRFVKKRRVLHKELLRKGIYRNLLKRTH